MVKEIDLEAGTRLKLKEIQSIELIPREGEESALHIISVNDVHFHIHQHTQGTVSMSIHGMKPHGKLHTTPQGEDTQAWDGNLCFDKISIFSQRGQEQKVSKNTKKIGNPTFSITDITVKKITI